MLGGQRVDACERGEHGRDLARLGAERRRQLEARKLVAVEVGRAARERKCEAAAERLAAAAHEPVRGGRRAAQEHAVLPQRRAAHVRELVEREARVVRRGAVARVV